MQPGAPLPVGHLLDGRYRIHKVLGVGGMGRVYLANDTRLANRPVAAKEMMIGDGVQERKAVEDFNREASVLARLSHPAIPQVIDYFGEQGRHYLVMEFVAGGDLQGRLDQMGLGGRLPEPQVLSMARQLLDVLQFLHSQKPPIIYRDLKPANIMIDQHGRSMLVDFGIARFLPPGGRGTQIGSVGYAPPEQYLGKMEPRSDLYALAATMHHLLSGRDPQLEPPFSFPNLSELAPWVSDQTASVVMRALDKEIDRRPASAREMRDLLPAPPAGTTIDSPPPSGANPRPSVGVIPAAPRNEPRGQSSLPTPRSLAASKAPAKVEPAVAGRKAKDPAQRLSIKPGQVATKRRLSVPVVPEPAKVSSTARTSDLGLKKLELSAPAEAARVNSRPAPLQSRLGTAISSVRAAISGTPIIGRAAPASAQNDKVTVREERALSGEGSRVPDSIHTQGQNGKAFVPSQPAVAAARLVSVADGLQFGLAGTRIVVGRANDNGDIVDVDLSRLRRGADRISRRHAEIIKQGGEYFVRDLGSVNGTYIAGRGRLGRDQLYKLKDRDELVFGGAKLEFRRG